VRWKLPPIPITAAEQDEEGLVSVGAAAAQLVTQHSPLPSAVGRERERAQRDGLLLVSPALDPSPACRP